MRGPLGGAGFQSALALGLRPGIRREFAGLAWPSNWAIRFSKRAMIACCRTMRAMRTSRLAVVRSTSVSMLCIWHNHRHPCQRSATRLRPIHLTKSELLRPNVPPTRASSVRECPLLRPIPPSRPRRRSQTAFDTPSGVCGSFPIYRPAPMQT